MELNINKRQFLIWMLTITISILTLGSQVLAAANPMNIMTINGSILPEYDNKYLLELYTITMTNTSDKPFAGELTWRIPKNSSKAFVAKNEDLSKNKSIGKTRSFGDYDELYWTPNKPIPPKGIVNWHIEYYNTTAIQGETEKKFTYNFKQPYKIDIASLVLLQPKKATNFQLIPAPENTKQSEQGQLYGYSLKDSQPNEEKIIKVNYTKTDPNPSFSSNSNTVAIGDNTGNLQGETSTAATPTSNNKIIMYLSIALIVLIAVVAIILLNKNEVKNQIVEKDKANEDDLNDDLNDYSGQELDVKDNKAKDKLKQDLINGMITESEYYEKLAELE